MVTVVPIEDLDEAIQTKKKKISDAELVLKKLEHDAQTLAKEKTVSVNNVANLEKLYEWIPEEKQ